MMMNTSGFLSNKLLTLHNSRLQSQTYFQYNFQKKMNTGIEVMLSIWNLYTNGKGKQSKVDP